MFAFVYYTVNLFLWMCCAVYAGALCCFELGYTFTHKHSVQQIMIHIYTYSKSNMNDTRLLVIRRPFDFTYKCRKYLLFTNAFFIVLAFNIGTRLKQTQPIRKYFLQCIPFTYFHSDVCIYICRLIGCSSSLQYKSTVIKMICQMF